MAALAAGKDSSSVVEWTQSPTDKTQKNAEHQHSCEAEWDMINTVSFKKKPYANGEGVVYEQDGIFIHSSTEDQDSLISGILRIIEKDGELVVEYKPLEDGVDLSNMLYAGKDSSSVVEWTQSPTDKTQKNAEHQHSCEAEWDMINTVSFKKKPYANGEGTSNHVHERSKWAFFFNVIDLQTIKIKLEGWSHLVFCLKDETSLPALHFHQGGSDLFIDCLKKYVLINESLFDERVLIVSNYSKSLSQSFENLFDDTTFGLVQHINELSMKLDVEEVLRKAEAICFQIKNCKDLPYAVREILEVIPDTAAPAAEICEHRALDTRSPPNATCTDELQPNPVPNGRDGNSGFRETAPHVYELAHQYKSVFSKIEEAGKVKNKAADGGKMAVVFSLKNEVGCLVKALRIFQEKHVNLVHIESRKSKRRNSEVEIYADCDCSKKEFNELILVLKLHSSSITLNPPDSMWTEQEEEGGLDGVPWFPRKIAELDQCSHRVLMYGSELDADHPGFKDNVYRQRRKYFVDVAMNYKYGQPIPRVEYTEEEVKTWGTVFRELTKLYPTHACREYLKNLPLLMKHCGYREDNVPQLEDVSKFLKERSGFTVRPVAGYLSPRDFLAGLAYRVFNCTQYIRHGTDPLYTPEPDTCHELLGHMPLLADPKFAQFSQEIGLASLGASDEDVQKLATQDVTLFSERSGFTVRPVAGYLSPRDFLAGLAYRVFNCTQYIRHGTDPLYTPEPDTCHELLGHMPLLADPKFAQFSQEIGLASLGASDEDVQKLATCYFFTIEFGLCKQEGQLRAYGAGLLSSIGELKHALSDKASVKQFDPRTTCNQECLITTFQEVYFVSESFEEAKDKMREFAKTIKRPFSVYFNPYTQSVEMLKDTRSIENVVQDLRSDLNTVCDALSKMNKYLGI
ncbi:UNVERIFIED_CONTAM: hypothetical protein FKN15_049915 [Acipenser sinensis]